MTTITIEIPTPLAVNYQETLRFITAKLYEADKITLDQAIRMTSLTPHEFMQLLIDKGIWIR
ncbi:UPF0175 family protein [Pedobacter panaciterrae]